MANTAKWELKKHGFLAFYLATEKAMSQRPIAEELAKGDHDVPVIAVDQSTVSRIVNATKAAIESDPNLQAEYDNFKKDFGTPRGVIFIKEMKGGKIVWTSPYKEGRDFLFDKSNAKSLNDMCTELNLIYAELGSIPPARWTREIVKPYIDKKAAEISRGTANERLIAIRNLLPKRFMKSGETPFSPKDYKPEPHEIIKQYDIFTAEVNGALKFMENQGQWFIAGVHRLHVTLGCREGGLFHERDVSNRSNGRGGLLGLIWKNLDWRGNAIDVFEGKTKGGIVWQGCPLDILGYGPANIAFLERLRDLKEGFQFQLDKSILPAGIKYQRTVITMKPDRDNILPLSYDNIVNMYRYVRAVYEKLYTGKNKFDEITPHTARHFHVNLLFERNVPSEIITGDAKTGQGFVGVGWQSEDVMKTYYLSLIRRRLQKYIDRAKHEEGAFTSFDTDKQEEAIVR